MEDGLTIVSIGSHDRLTEILEQAVDGLSTMRIDSRTVSGAPLNNRRVLFAVSLDAYGMADGMDALTRRLRKDLHAMDGSIGAVLLDAKTELYSKAAGRQLVFDANRAGCMFPSKPFVEATGSLQNYHVLSTISGVDLMSAYKNSALDLVRRLMAFEPKRTARPNILLLHASNRSSSNTLALGIETVKRLEKKCDVTEIPLFSGEIYDCNGCSFRACSHFARQQKCFYGGIVPDIVFPAIEKCNALLLCCPNYNDAPGAFFLALNNRLNAFGLRGTTREMMLYAIIVSGYSGGDLVAEQLSGGFCLNKFFSLPPRFALIETANDPGSAMRSDGIMERLDNFADNIRTTVCV